MIDVTRTLARFVVASRPADVPGAVTHEARRAMLHWIGCALGGSRHESVECALAALDEFSGPRHASVLGRRQRLDVMHAALINGMSADALGFSDTHLGTIIHPGGVIGPAVLALAERTPVSGEALLHAFLLGIEVACRVGLCVHPWHYDRGWHISGTAGTFGAAAAAGRLLGLDEQRMTWALGLAATQAAGLRAMLGSMTKSFHGGRAAQNGVLAAVLAAKGFTSSDQGLEHRRGFAHVMGEAPNFAAITDELGVRFEVLQNTYKAFPGGVVTQSTIDGCVTLASARHFAAAEIDSVTLRVNPLVLELCGRTLPVNTSEAKLSVFHAAAAAILRGRASEHEFSLQTIRDPEVAALRARVSAIADERIRKDEADVTIRLTNGATLHHHVDHAIGSAARPMTDAHIETKVRGLAEGVLPSQRVEDLIRACWELDRAEDAAQLARLATPEPDAR